MSRIDGIIFDCDGVLFESRNANLAYYNQVLERFAYPLVSHEQKEKAHLCHTASSVDVLGVLMKEEDIKPALDFAATLDFRNFIPFMEPKPHLAEVLEQLAAKYPLAVATNRGNSVEPILSHFGLEDYFTAIVTSKDVAKPKPAPDMLFLATEQLGFAPENCLFVGDSELDLMAAAGAKVRFVGYGGLKGGEAAVDCHLQLLKYLPK